MDLQENETANIDISGSYSLSDGGTYYVVVWSPYFPNNYDWNWFLNDPMPFTIDNSITPEPQYTLGDVNNDGKINIGDVTELIRLLLLNAEYNIAADMDEDGKMNIGDVTALINYLLTNGSSED